jgi:hypothetical protein
VVLRAAEGDAHAALDLDETPSKSGLPASSLRRFEAMTTAVD